MYALSMRMVTLTCTAVTVQNSPINPSSSQRHANEMPAITLYPNPESSNAWNRPKFQLVQHKNASSQPPALHCCIAGIGGKSLWISGTSVPGAKNNFRKFSHVSKTR